MSDELDPNKYHMLSKSQKKSLILILTTAFVIFGPIITFFYYSFAINRPAQVDIESSFEIKSGQGLNDIAKNLYLRNLVNSETLFKAYVLLNNMDDSIEAGVYKIPAGVTIIDLAGILQHGTDDASVTFLEGWRVEEFARLANQRLKDVDYETFVKEAKQYEGYLFPDTYYLSSDTTEQSLLDLLRNTFNQKTKDVLTEENLSKAKLTLEQAVIIASIIEREERSEEERPIVAGILIKRWKNDQLIGADATTQYAIAAIRAGCPLESSEVCPKDEIAKQVQWWPQDITSEELSFNSPFNTRKNAGLPPAPICNPSLSALKATINYTSTPYNYYLHDKTGLTHYAKTLEEHNLNVAKYLSE